MGFAEKPGLVVTITSIGGYEMHGARATAVGRIRLWVELSLRIDPAQSGEPSRVQSIRFARARAC
jgi:hypothetical protein